jgi:hypothetical protein
MKTLLTLLSILIAPAAQAATRCTIYENNGDGFYQKELYQVEISFQDHDPSSSKFAYIKPDGSVVSLTWKEVQEKKDFSDVNLSTFFNFRMTSAANTLTISFGDVDVSRKEVRRLISSSNAERKLVVWALDKYAASCL